MPHEWYAYIENPKKNALMSFSVQAKQAKVSKYNWRLRRRCFRFSLRCTMLISAPSATKPKSFRHSFWITERGRRSASKQILGILYIWVYWRYTNVCFWSSTGFFSGKWFVCILSVKYLLAMCLFFLFFVLTKHIYRFLLCRTSAFVCSLQFWFAENNKHWKVCFLINFRSHINNVNKTYVFF